MGVHNGFTLLNSARSAPSIFSPSVVQEALDVDDGDETEDLSGLGSATDDLDDYINQVDAELGMKGEGEGQAGSREGAS